MIFYEVLIQGRLSALKSDSSARAKSLSLQITTLKELVWFYTEPPAMTCVGLENETSNPVALSILQHATHKS